MMQGVRGGKLKLKKDKAARYVFIKFPDSYVHISGPQGYKRPPLPKKDRHAIIIMKRVV